MVCAVILIVYITQVAKVSLEQALEENEEIEGLTSGSPRLPIVAETGLDLKKPLIVKIDPSGDDHVK